MYRFRYRSSVTKHRPVMRHKIKNDNRFNNNHYGNNNDTGNYSRYLEFNFKIKILKEQVLEWVMK